MIKSQIKIAKKKSNGIHKSVQKNIAIPNVYCIERCGISNALSIKCAVPHHLSSASCIKKNRYNPENRKKPRRTGLELFMLGYCGTENERTGSSHGPV